MDKTIEEVARTPITSHKYKGKRYLTVDGAEVIRQIFIKHLREVVEGAELTDEEIKEKLGEIQPEGFDWVNITEAETYKFRAIANAATAKVKGLMKENNVVLLNWLEEYAKHCGQATLEQVLDDIRVHSSFPSQKGLMEAEHKAEIELAKKQGGERIVKDLEELHRPDYRLKEVIVYLKYRLDIKQSLESRYGGK